MASDSLCQSIYPLGTYPAPIFSGNADFATNGVVVTFGTTGPVTMTHQANEMVLGTSDFIGALSTGGFQVAQDLNGPIISSDNTNTVTVTGKVDDTNLTIQPALATGKSYLSINARSGANEERLVLASGGQDVSYILGQVFTGSGVALPVLFQGGAAGNTLACTLTAAATPTFDFEASSLRVKGSSSGQSLIKAPATGGGTVTMPAGSKTLMANDHSNLASSVSTIRGTATAGNQTGTTSTAAFKMNGSATAITPAVTGNVLVMWSCFGANSTLLDGGKIRLAYGTGTAPANGDAATGTLTGAEQWWVSAVANQYVGLSSAVLITGLTPSTAYWLDWQIEAITGGTASIFDTVLSYMEI